MQLIRTTFFAVHSMVPKKLQARGSQIGRRGALVRRFEIARASRANIHLHYKNLTIFEKPVQTQLMYV